MAETASGAAPPQQATPCGWGTLSPREFAIRLTATVAFLVLALSGAAGVALRFVRAASEDRAVAAQHAFRDTLDAERLRGAAHGSAAAARGYWLTRNPLFLERLTAENERFDALSETLRGRRASTPELERVRASADRYRSAQDALVKAVSSLPPGESLGGVVQDALPMRTEFREALDAFVGATQTRLEAETAAQSRFLRRALFVDAAVLLSALCVTTLLVGFFLFRVVQAYRREDAALLATRDALAARQAILGVVAHDLRSPLNALGIQAQLLKRSSSEGKTRERAASMVKVVGRMDRLIRNLVDHAALDAGRLSVEETECTVGELVREASELADTLASARAIVVTSAIELPPETVLQVDRDRMLQVLTNLLGNAIKFSPRGGSVMLAVARADQELRFSISDEGPGIAPEHLPHIFERFWSHSEGGARGTGLGLSISKAIVEAHGGRIWVESATGQGTTVSFTLPVHASPFVRADQAPSDEARGEGHGEAAREAAPASVRASVRVGNARELPVDRDSEVTAAPAVPQARSPRRALRN